MVHRTGTAVLNGYESTSNPWSRICEVKTASPVHGGVSDAHRISRVEENMDTRGRESGEGRAAEMEVIRCALKDLFLNPWICNPKALIKSII